MGKAAKQRKNIEAKIAITEEEKRKERELIKSLKDDTIYHLYRDGINFLTLTGKQIKEI